MRNLFDGPGIFIVILLLVVLFGAKRLPDAARGIGRSLRIFKSEVKQMKDEDPAPAPAPVQRPVEPLEGRVVQNGQNERATTPGETSRRDV
jgi:sec-independent protein translocase protein TatA